MKTKIEKTLEMIRNADSNQSAKPYLSKFTKELTDEAYLGGYIEGVRDMLSDKIKKE